MSTQQENGDGQVPAGVAAPASMPVGEEGATRLDGAVSRALEERTPPVFAPSQRPEPGPVAVMARAIRAVGFTDPDGCTLCIAEDAAMAVRDFLARAGFVLTKRRPGA